MSNKQATLYSFFSSFGITAYPAHSVPDDKAFPWLTYEVTTDDWGGQPVGIGVNLWYHTESEKEPNAKVKEISDALGLGGVMLTCDEGAIWVKKGSPFCQNLSDDSDDTIKRRFLNVTLEFYTL